MAAAAEGQGAPTGRRKLYIEALRILACFCVIVNHTNSQIFLSTAPSRTWYVSLTYFFVSKVAVPIFLFIMGAVLLDKQDSAKKYLSRLGRMLIVLVVSSLLYYLYFRAEHLTDLSCRSFFRNSFLWGDPVTNAYWYLYLYFALLCILPLLQAMAAAFTRGQLLLLLFFSLVVAGTGPLIMALTPWRLTVLSRQGILFSPYIGMVFAGYYVEHRMEVTRTKAGVCALLFLGLIAFQVAATGSLYQKDPADYLALDDRTMITITGSALCVFVAVKYLFSRHRLPAGVERGICRLGSLTFGIYLISDWLLIVTRPLYQDLCAHLHVFPAMLLWELGVFLLGAGVTALCRCIPPLRKIL